MHIQVSLRTAQPVRWTWPLAICCWLLEQAGIADLQTTPDTHLLQGTILLDCGFDSAAMRQRPIGHWRIGQPSMQPGIALPGGRIHMDTTTTRRDPAHVNLILSEQHRVALDGLTLPAAGAAGAGWRRPQPATGGLRCGRTASSSLCAIGYFVVSWR